MLACSFVYSSGTVEYGNIESDEEYKQTSDAAPILLTKAYAVLTHLYTWKCYTTTASVPLWDGSTLPVVPPPVYGAPPPPRRYMNDDESEHENVFEEMARHVNMLVAKERGNT